MYVAGVMAYRQNWLASVETVKKKWLWIALGVLVLLLPVMMVFGEDPERGFDLFMGGLYWQAVAFATWESFMCIVVSWFQRDCRSEYRMRIETKSTR